MKKIIILCVFFLHSLFLFSADIPQEILQNHIVPKYTTTPQERLSSRLVCKAFLARDLMPSSLDDKIFQKELTRQCIFLSSVYEKDHDAVQWILDHDITYQKKVMSDGTIRPEMNRFFYYSVYSLSRRQGCFTPFMVANHKEDEKMLKILALISSDRYSLCRLSLTASDQMPYELYQIACLKQDPLLHIEDFKKLELHILEGNTDDFGAAPSHRSSFFLMALLNNDERLFKFMVRVCHKNPNYPTDENDLMSTDVSSIDLGLTLKYIATLENEFENEDAKCVTEEKIKKIIEHPFVEKQKNFILDSVYDSLSRPTDQYDYSVWRLVEKLLIQKGAQATRYSKPPSQINNENPLLIQKDAQAIEYPKRQKQLNNNQWKFPIIVSKKILLITTLTIGLTIYLISLHKKLFSF